MLADKIHAHFRFRELFDHVVLLTAVAVIYVGLAKLSLALASIHPSATPIWPPTGYALAIILLSGYRVSPAVFLGAFIANLTTAGSIGTEPPRVRRRPFGLSHAAMAGCSSMA